MKLERTIPWWAKTVGFASAVAAGVVALYAAIKPRPPVDDVILYAGVLLVAGYAAIGP